MIRRPTTQDITWFLDQDRNKQLVLDPPYQRRSVWTLKDRRFFLDTIFKGFPCPAIFLHKQVATDGRATYEVVDGKQRLETILMFAHGKIALDADYDDARLAGKKWSDLGESERRIFWNYVLPVEQLEFSPNETATINDAFDRLNRNSRKLGRQELRHARYEGWFIGVVEAEGALPFWREVGVVTNARAKRMKDAQFLSELLLVVIERQQHGFDQDHLDAAYAKYDEPDEEGVSLDTEGVIGSLEEAKSLLKKLNDVNQCVRDTASNVGAFYTLWSYIVLHRQALPPTEEFVVQYSKFAGVVDQFRQGVSVANGPLADSAARYARALQGASTDLAARQVRLDALVAAMKVK